MDKSKLISVFTPTYNRAHTLEALYDSLKAQTFKGFVWLIVDDGSTDGTRALAEKFIAEGAVAIRYHYQPNAGKTQAHNKGVQLTDTLLFVCVDSDDTLVPSALEKIANLWSKPHCSDCIGIIARRDVATMKKDIPEYTTLIDAYRRKYLMGDSMLVYLTNVLKGQYFPQFKNEKFVPEAWLYDRLDTKGVLRVINEPLYLCKYLEDGYTRGMARLLCANPLGYIAYINQRLKLHSKSLRERFANSTRYVAICIAGRQKSIVRNAVYPLTCAIAYLPGLLFYLLRYRKCWQK